MDFFAETSYHDRVKASVDAIADHLELRAPPMFSLTLGSGLTDLIGKMDVIKTISYDKVGLPVPVAEGHAGDLILGDINGVSVLCQSGRRHWNEVAHLPHGIMEVVFATHVMASLGIRRCFTTNAVGALNTDYRVGDMMIITDHINMIPNPATGPHIDFGDNPYFPPMNTAYDTELSAMFLRAAQDADAGIRSGIYLGVTGRTYETAAECRAYRSWGADTVGMSTTPEIIAATSRGMTTIGVSIVTNVVDKDGTNATNHEEVLKVLHDPALRRRMANTFHDFFDLYARSL